MSVDKFVPFGELLQTFRKQKKVRQQFLADQLGVHRNTIGAWERGDRLPDTKGIVLELAKQLRLDNDETRHLLEASLTALSSYWNVPYPRNPYFTGRSALLSRLHQHLYQGQTVALSQSYALSGLGGIGKTQLALEYVYQHAHEYQAIFWIAAETHETVLSSFDAIAEQLRLPERKEKEQQRLVSAILRWLATHKEWLIVFDNVEDVATLKSFLPPARQGAILMTTRLHTLEGIAQTLEISSFTIEEGSHFLLSRAGFIDPTTSINTLSDELLASASILVETMDGLPLALDQAGAYIERVRCSLTDYMHLFQHHQITLLNERSTIADHPFSVMKTFVLSFEQLMHTNAAAADLVRVCAFLAPDAIPEELFAKGASYLGSLLEAVAIDPYLFNQTLGEALHYSLLTRQPQNHTLSMHRLVQVVLRGTFSETERRMWAERVVLAVNAIFPDGEHGTWLQCESLLPHVLVSATWIEHEPIFTSEAAHLLHKAGIYLRERAQYSEAETLLLQAVRICEQHLGTDHLDTASTLHNLAFVYWKQGKYEQAEPLYLRALMIREQYLGTEHLTTAKSLNNLAIIYHDQGKYEEAALLHQRALAIREQHIEAEYSDTASSLNNLAIVCYDQGKYEEAESLYQRALAIWEQHLGAEHPNTASSLNNLAELYRQQGKYEKAESLYQRALAIWEQHLGAEHPDTAKSLNNLAELYHLQGNYEKAETLHQRGLTIREHCLGTEHPDTAESLHGLAELYQHQEKYEQAEALYYRALAIREQKLGPAHPLTKETQNAYTTFLHIAGYDVKDIYTSHEPSITEGDR